MGRVRFIPSQATRVAVDAGDLKVGDSLGVRLGVPSVQAPDEERDLDILPRFFGRKSSKFLADAGLAIDGRDALDLDMVIVN